MHVSTWPVSNIHVCEGGLVGCELDDVDWLYTVKCKHIYSLRGHKHGGKLAAQTWLEQEGSSKSRSKSFSTRDSLEIRTHLKSGIKPAIVARPQIVVASLPGPCHLTRPCTRYNSLEICPIHFQFCSLSSSSSPSLPLSGCLSLSLDNHSNPENHANGGSSPHSEPPLRIRGQAPFSHRRGLREEDYWGAVQVVVCKPMSRPYLEVWPS